MGFFDDSHVTDVGLQGSLGPSVGFGEMFGQGFHQQFRVDSARALDDELRNRWLASLRAAQIKDQVNVAPDPLGRNPQVDPDDPWVYRAFAQHVSGQPVDAFDPNKPLWGYDPTARLKGMIDANEKIKALNNPDIKSFEQILEEVSAMQREVEGETVSMSERSGTGGFIASLLGAIGGSFTTRDPLNIITAPVGAGRTVFTRIASEMGLAASVVGYTELAEVAPARKIAGLPERDPLYNIAAATLGAGGIRGGIEGIGYGVRRLRGEDIDFDLRDSQLQQMFEANAEKPSARAGLQLLDDTQFIERNNPYGEGRAAQERFLAELRQVQRVMGGEPMTAVARALPPIPYEQLKKAADFEIVKEQAPQVYARMEAAQAKLSQVSEPKGFEIIAYHGSSAKGLKAIKSSIEAGGKSTVRGKGNAGIYFSLQPEYARAFGSELYEVAIDLKNPKKIVSEGNTLSDERLAIETAFFDQDDIARLKAEGYDGIVNEAVGEIVVFDPKQVRLLKVNGTKVNTSKVRRAANAEYRAAYRDVETEAIRLRDQQARVEATQQREAVGIFADATAGRPFNWSALQYDSVQARVDAINAFNETLDEKAVAAFVRQVEGEGEEAVEREVWRTEGGIDIGLREPVDPEFRISTDDGDMTVEAAMRDLQDDADLDDAMRTCLL